MVKYTTKVWLTVVGDITDVPLQTITLFNGRTIK